jgi:hypothetical protein
MSWVTPHGGPSASGQRFLEVDVVPEVPMTGMVMGIGALAIAAGHTLRRKQRLISSNILAGTMPLNPV